MSKEKKFYSILIILFTLIYVSIVIYPYKSNIIMESKGKILAVVYKIKNINITKLFKSNTKYQVIYEDVKQNSEVAVNDSSQDDWKEEEESSSNTLPKAIREAKINRMNKNQIEFIDDIKSTSDSSISNENATEGVSATIQDETKECKITNLEKERLLSFARKLSPIDQAKIENYLRNQDEADVGKTLNLLKERLTDDEYEKLKDLELKFQKSDDN